ncbi:MAG: hypothetical protein ACJ8F7_21345 [Gemmataceae bacterium]
MYEFIQTENGWLVCWGPTPAEQGRAAAVEPELAEVVAGDDARTNDVAQPMAV